ELEEEQAQKRLRAQFPIDQKKLEADFLIDNSFSREETERQVEALLAEIRAELRS
ncbi:dephospho-CoA kinase, partial [Mesorhizobium sp. M00.F.Ca.ET.186.01.1.1]